ncbi:SgcJ/EcaC family oxidoreductase [Rhodophyticola porphyridii]|uniref:SgcJ/EcaC family oxidoreductase n=1 Tax=Rhodophyticola porphyridii TaxID=1852017 RepID=UPI0035D0A6D7
MTALPQSPREIPAAFVAAWAVRDTGALAALFASDAGFVNVVGIWWEDRAAIEGVHDHALTRFFAQSRPVLGPVKPRWIGEGVAVIRARMRLSGQLAPDGAEAPARGTILSFVAEKTARGWRLLSAQNTDIVPGAETQLASATGLRPQDYGRS